MKKIFKGLSILVASTALCGGIAMATACSGGYNGTYTGEYHYENYGSNYGMVVEVTVENNIITGVKDITNTEAAKTTYQDNKEWHTVSQGWLDYYLMMWGFGKPQGNIEPIYEGEGENKTLKNGAEIEAIMPTGWYGWSNADAANWVKYENWLLQQYVGWSVADILDIDVFYGSTGEPYGTKGGYNAELAASGLVIANATQGSGRLMLAVQDALKK